MFTREKYKNKEVQENRDEHIALAELYSGLDNALREINESVKNVKDMGIGVPDEVVKIRKAIKSESKKIERRMRKLHIEYLHMIEKCDHDFTYEGESYGGNFTQYRCKKCGTVKTVKE